MATETGAERGFGHVSRRLDVVFRYLLLAATLVGIVMLGVLLVYVANDAFQPLTADTGWLATFLATLVGPTVAVSGWLLYRNYAAFSFGWIVIGMGIVGFLFASGAAIAFIDIVPPLTWLAYLLAVALSFAVLVGLQSVDWRVPYLARIGATVGVLIGSILTVPPLVAGLTTVPTDASIILVTIGGPVAAIIGLKAEPKWDRPRAGLIAGAAAFGIAIVGMVFGPFVGLDPLPGTLVFSLAVLPAMALAAFGYVDRPEARIGLVLPVLVVGGVLLGWVIVQSMGFDGPNSWVTWEFLTSPHSGTAEDAGFYPAIGGSIILMVIVAALSFPLGVGTAIYLEEYAPRNRFTRIIQVNISNLAGVPSVVYGLLGLGVFVTYLGQPPGTAFVGGATLALLILPIVIIAAAEAIRSVPNSLRAASDGMGATRWQTVRNVVLPRAFPGILTGTILALGRAIGETAPLIMIGAPNVFFSLPTDLQSRVGAMPLQIYAWASLFAGEEFYTKVVPAGVVVLLIALLAMNSVAIALRNTYQNRA